MREIKFRAYNKMTGVMNYNLDDWNVSWLNDHQYNLMQYTGLKDKNGKEIYEGDLLQYNNSDGDKLERIDVVELGVSEMSVMLFKDTSVKHHSGYQISIPQNCEVIGNIYENPELLHD